MPRLYLPPKIIIRDTTLREGLDVPGVEKRLSLPLRLRIAKKIYDLGIREFDIIHPGRVNPHSVWLANRLRQCFGTRIRVHGAVYAYNSKLASEISLMAGVVDDIDLVMPVIEQREPYSCKEKIAYTIKGLKFLQRLGRDCGVGFANASQCDRKFLLRFSQVVAKAGAKKIILYDSVGLLDPWETYRLVRQIKTISKIHILYHCHNDLGLAVANSLLAVYGGASYIDASINGIGDRAGNAALEQLAVTFHLKRVKTGIQLKKLRTVSNLVEKLCEVRKAPNHPITGSARILFAHTSPKHKLSHRVFEVMNPELLGYPRSRRR